MARRGAPLCDIEGAEMLQISLINIVHDKAIMLVDGMLNHRTQGVNAG